MGLAGCVLLYIGMKHPGEIGMGVRAGAVGVEESEFAGLGGGEFPM